MSWEFCTGCGFIEIDLADFIVVSEARGHRLITDKHRCGTHDLLYGKKLEHYLQKHNMARPVESKPTSAPTPEAVQPLPVAPVIVLEPSPVEPVVEADITDVALALRNRWRHEQ